MSGDPAFGTEAEWEAARAAAKADVQAALARPPRPCPNCGRPQPGIARRCADCGADMFPRRTRPKPGLRAGLIAILVLAALAALVFGLIPAMREDADTERRLQAERQTKLEAAERARLRIEVRPVSITGPRRRSGESRLEHRARLLAVGSDAITADARKRVAAGTMDGPILGTSCEPYPETDARRALEQDPNLAAARYECIAIERRVPLSKLNGRERTGIFGNPYWLVIEFDTAELAFCKISPKVGEGGKVLATVAIPEPCRDPLRKD